MRALLLASLLLLPSASAQAPVFTPIWSADVPAETEPHAPVVGDGVVLVTSSDGSMQGFLLREGGEQAWRTQTAARGLSPPMVHTSLFLVGGDDARVRAHFILSGEEMFNFTLGAPVLQNMSQTREAWIVLDESGRVSGHSKSDGRILWQKEVGPGAHSLQVREADGTFAVATRDDVILYELERRDQQERRTLPGVVCIVESPDELYALRATGVHRLRETDFVDAWVVGVPAADCGMLDGRNLYVPTRNGTVAALAADHPTLVWETPVLGAMPHVLHLLDDWLLVTTNASGDGSAAVHLVDARDGRVAATHPLEGRIASASLRSRWLVGSPGDWGADQERRVEDYVVVRTDARLQAFTMVLPERGATPTPAGATPPAGPQDATPAPDVGDAGTPGFVAPIVLAALVVGALWRRRA